MRCRERAQSIEDELVARADEIAAMTDTAAVETISAAMKDNKMWREGPAIRDAARIWLAFLRGEGPAPQLVPE